MRAFLFFVAAGALLWFVATYDDSPVGHAIERAVSAGTQEVAGSEALEKVTVHGVYLTPGANTPAVILEDAGASRRLPIWIGYPEADAIRRRLEDEPPPRPLTHELLVELIGRAGADVSRVVVTELRDNTYFARIDLVVDGESLTVEARPSDAIALALGVSAPIYVAESVLEEAARLDIVFDGDDGDDGSDLPPPETEGWVGCGIWCQPLDPELGAALGVMAGLLVADLSEAQPADDVLHRGDVILEVGGQPALSVAEVNALLGELDDGDVVPVVVMRDGVRTDAVFSCR